MMLVRTPTPYPKESQPGYVLRVSETNGYDTPWPVLQLADIYYSALGNAALPIRRLSPILGVPESVLFQISYTHGSGESDHNKQFRLLGHQLGRGQKCQPFRLKSPCVCPQCVAENGYLPAAHDAAAVIACGRHRRLLVSNCPECGMPLSWFRPGLLTCKCGGSLAAATPEEVPESLADLMSILVAKIEGGAPPISRSRLPIQGLMAIPLKDLLKKLPELGALASDSSAATSSMAHLMSEAAHVLADWPTNFRSFLKSYGESLADEERALPLCQKYQGLYNLFFKASCDAANFSWMRAEFLRFGLEEDHETRVDSRLFQGEDVERRFMTRPAFVRHFGLTASALRRWEEKGVVEFKEVKTASGTRYVADMQALKLEEAESPDDVVLNTFQAAASLEIPVSVLNFLKREGRIIARNPDAKHSSYTENAIRAFRMTVVANTKEVQPAAVNGKELISLSSALLKLKFHQEDAKGRLMLEYLEGRLQAIGRTGDRLSDVYFDLTLILEYVELCRSEHAHGAVSQVEAAKTLQCNPAGIPVLIEMQYLQGVSVPAGTKVTSESLKEFKERYIPVGVIADQLGTNSKRIAHLAHTYSVPLLEARFKHGTVLFVERLYEPCLRDLNEQKNSKNAAWCERPRIRQESLRRLEEFLDEHRKSGKALPTRNGRLNKSEIARRCEFDLTRLYKDEDFVCVLNKAIGHLEYTMN